MKKIIRKTIFFIFSLTMMLGITVQANNVVGNVTDRGEGFSTNFGEKSASWYDKGTTAYTGNSVSARPELKVGQHYFRKSAAETPIIPISKWVVDWKPMTCIHTMGGDQNSNDRINFFGFDSYHYKICYRPLHSGWLGYCRDCGDMIQFSYLNMTKDVAESISSIKNNYGYVYVCPFCDGLNTAVEIDHECNSNVSYNQYFIMYKGNGATEGFTGMSTHIYDNFTEFEGNKITPDTKLSTCFYEKTGHMFTGWNTKPDGTGTTFKNEEEVLNLTTENNKTIYLYAQWKPINHYLEIDPNGGAYNGNKEITSLYKPYGTTYSVNGKVTPPAGYAVSFDSMGGNDVSPIVTTTTFDEWELSGHQDKETAISGFKGKFKNNIYSFLAKFCEYHDILIAKYTNDEVILPGTSKSGYLFAGWYSNKDLNEESYVGTIGHKYKPTENTTLYAKWASLQLVTSLPTKKDANGNSVTCYDGTINANWFWNEPFSSMVTYEYYLSTDNKDWNRIYKNSDSVDSNSEVIDQSFPYTGNLQTFKVKSSGFYDLTTAGSQGGNFSNKPGGAAFTTKEKLWLSEGENLAINVGGQNGISGGNSAYNGGGGYPNASSVGGAATAITLNGPRANRNNLLLSVAGGGGGASIWYNGVDASSQASSPGINNTRPDGGSSGTNTYSGGGGRYGGSNTKVFIHYHTGNSSSGGGCYGNHQVGQRREERPNYITFTSSNGPVTCFNCHKTSAFGTATFWACGGMDWIGTCPNCGRSSSGGTGHSATIVTYVPYDYYDLNCGYGQGQVLSADPGFGGSSYINSSNAVSYSFAKASNSGSGRVQIQSTDNGYIDDQFLNKIPTKDVTNPDAIDVANKEAIYLVGEGIDNQVTVKWLNPKDNGTKYYSKIEAKLVLSSSGQTLDSKAFSNTCQDTLTSEVAGFYYLVDKKPSTRASINDNYVMAGNGMTDVSVSLIQDQKQWIHFITIDHAGNMSQTVHYEIPAGTDLAPEVPSKWNIYTTPFNKVEGADGNVLLKDLSTNTWFVRADGKTPYKLSYTGYTNTISGDEWQINLNNFNAFAGLGEEVYSVYTPNAPFTEGTIEYTSGFNKKYDNGTPMYLVDNTYTKTIRSNGIKNLFIEQAFTTAQNYSGVPLNVQPKAGAYQLDEWGDDVSTYSEDGKEHAINIIPDGYGPFIGGLEELNDIGDIDFDNITDDNHLKYTITAVDELSGTASLAVQITNADNNAEWTSSTNGEPIDIDITDGSLLFKGEFSIKVTAIDKVGNVTTNIYNPYECSLSAKLERILTPRDTQLQAGESATIYMNSTGYIDTLQLIYSIPVTPDNEAKYDKYKLFYDYITENGNVIDKYKKTNEYRITYDYQNDATYDDPLLHEGIISPKVDFMVPLYTPDGDYTVTIKAFKDGREISILERKLHFQVKGSILDDFRTRIRSAH